MAMCLVKGKDLTINCASKQALEAEKQRNAALNRHKKEP